MDTNGIFEKCVSESTTKEITNEEYLILKRLFQKEINKKNKSFLDVFQRDGRSYAKIKNYVGTVVFGNGKIVDIVPKITDVDNAESIERSKRILAEMISICGNIDGKRSNELQQTGTLIDIFTEAFLNLLEESGEDPNGLLFGSYSVKEILNNVSKVLTDKSIRVRIDNISNKKISKSADKLEKNISLSKSQIRFCKQYLKSVRGIISGSSVCSLLFSMQKLYELCIGRIVEKNFSEYGVNIQDKTMLLYDEGPRKLKLRPDIVIGKNEKIVIDTKWKIVKKDDDVKRADLEQMYHYSARYKAPATVLLYPESSVGQPTILKKYRHEKYDVLPKCVVLEPIEEKTIELINQLIAQYLKSDTPVGDNIFTISEAEQIGEVKVISIKFRGHDWVQHDSNVDMLAEICSQIIEEEPAKADNLSGKKILMRNLSDDKKRSVGRGLFLRHNWHDKRMIPALASIENQFGLKSGEILVRLKITTDQKENSVS